MIEPDARAYNRQALDPTRSVVVSACAGSGKTWLLVSRMVRLLLAGVAPGEILAITFTRKAAQEMAARLRAWLQALAGPDADAVRGRLRALDVPESDLEQALPIAQGLYEQLLTAQPEITISTFHGWFLQLLRAAPLDSGALGSVTLTERASPLLAEAWERYGQDCRREPQSAATRGLDTLFGEFGLENTRRLLTAFVHHRAEWWAHAGRDADAIGRALAVQAAGLSVAVDADVRGELLRDPAFVDALRTYARLLCGNRVDDKPRGEAILDTLDNPDAVFDALRDAVFTQAGPPRKRSVTAAFIKKFGSDAAEELLRLNTLVLERTQAALDALADQESYRINAAGLAAGVALLEHYQAVKRDRQVVDFTDVEWLAYDLLVHGEHALAMQLKLDNRYRHVLLDEFQDTNALQWLTLEAWLAAAAEADAPPAVFLVGDPKQAIYRFRRAEPRLFEVAHDWLVEHCAAVAQERDESRRSARSVLDVVNRVFEGEPLFAPFFRTHRAHYTGLPGRVEVLPVVVPVSAARVPAGDALALRDPLAEPLILAEDARRALEAEVLAERLQEIVAHWGVIDDPHAGLSRRAGYGDIMLLVRRRTHLETYERALRHAGIPFITSRQGGLLDTLEAADLIALLEFLIAPFDDLRLAHALRSPVFSCTDDELAMIACAEGASWWARLEGLAHAGTTAALARAQGLLAIWLARADMLPVHDQLDRIYFEGDVLRRYAAAVPSAMRTAVAANLDAFIQRALEVDAGRYPSLPRFVAELSDLREAPDQEAPDEGSLGEPGNAVRILTVHGAKGLEAPIVWLLDTGAAAPVDRGYGVMIDWPPGTRAPDAVSLFTRVRDHSTAQRRLAAAEAEHAAREDLDLLYVAMTRARQALIVSACEPGAPGSWHARVLAATRQASGATQSEGGVVHGDALTHEASAGDPVAARPAIAPIDPSLERPVPTGKRMPVVEGKGLRYGTVFHALMERSSADRSVDPEAVRVQLGLGTTEFEQAWKQATQLMQTPSLRRFFDPAVYVRALNELPLVTPDGELRRLDRVVEFEEAVWVLDYKTGDHAAVDGTALLIEYRAQVAGYCAALRLAYPGKVVRGALVFADATFVEVEA